MNNNKHISILHAFNPSLLFKVPQHEEVRFVWGRYLDIATAKGKDPRSLYFGTSKNSNLLTGIFLGDYELTSRVKDVKLESHDDIITLSIKYIDDKGKLITVKANLPSSAAIDDIKETLELLKNQIQQLIDSVNSINDRLEIIDGSLFVLDSSVKDIISQLDNGKYNYTIHKSESSYAEGCKQIYTLFKGDDEQLDSSAIEILDYTLKTLEYDDENNKLIATSWPAAADSSIVETTYIDDDGNEVTVTKRLDPEYIYTTELDLTPLEQHFINTVNTDSPVNDRLVIVENQLKWENLINE